MILGRRRIDPNTDEVLFRDGRQVPIKRHARQLLRVLAAADGRTVTKDQLMDAIWPDVTVSEDSLYQAVAEARRALGPDGSEVIRTVPRKGYRLSRPDRPAASRRSHRTGAALAALLLICGGLLAFRPAPIVEAQHPVLAVLPFEALSGQERMQRLGRGLSVEIASAMAQNEWLDVIAPEASDMLKDHPPLAAAESLGARYLLDGSLAGDDQTLRVSARLTDVATGKVLWSERWSRSAEGFLDLETVILDRVAGSLGGALTGVITRADLSVARDRQPNSLDAYDHFLLGLDAKHHWNAEGFALAVTHFRKAIDLDPDYAKAWSFLSLTLSFQALDAATHNERLKLWNEAHATAERAYSLNPDDPEVLWRVARERAARGDFPNAEKTLRRSVSLAPGNADVLMVAAWTSHYSGIRGDEPLAWARRAHELTPTRPAKYTISLGLAAFAARDYVLCVETLRNAPPSVEVLAHLSAAEALLGNISGAREVSRQMREAYPNFVLDDLFGPGGLEGFTSLDDMRQGAILAGLPISRTGPT